MKSKRFVVALVSFAVLAAIACAAAVKSGGQDRSEESMKKVDEFLGELEKTRGKFWNPPRTDSKLLHMLIKMNKSKKVLELGTSNGYSSIWMALALEETGGKLTTIEIDEGRANIAKQNFQRAGVSDRIEVIVGDAHKVARELEGPFDFIFMDAEKGNEMDYFNVLYPKLEPGGVIALHNVIQYKSSMTKYLDHVANHPNLDTVIVSTDLKDGLSVSYRKK